MENRRRKTLSLLVCVGMLCVALVGGTMAYLTDAEGAMSNTFATGDVDIALHETVGKNGVTEDFTVNGDDSAALPSQEYKYDKVMPGDTLTKNVSVSNTGSEPVYVRVFVTVNNALKINNAIDEFYEDKDWADKEIQAVYDQVFQGWGLNYTKGSSVNGMRCAIDEKLPTGVDHVDSVKTIVDYVNTYNGNWFGETNGVVGLNGYYANYTNDEAGINEMGQYEFRYVYYMQLDPGEKVELFQGLNVPADFTAEQLEMFDGLKIDVSAEAIQAANVAKGTTAGDYKKVFSVYDASLNGENATLVSSNEELNEAVKNGATTLLLSDGTYVMPSFPKGSNVTIIGNWDSIIDVQRNGGEHLDYAFDGSTVTFNGVAFNTSGNTYDGFARMDATYNACLFTNTYTLYGNSVFNNCTFNVEGDKYNLWTWGAPTVDFNNCTFNSDGKALLLYGIANTKMIVNGCIFNDSGVLPDLKAAIEIGNDYGKSYSLTVNNTTVNGYEVNDKGINTGTTLWANKNSMSKQNLNVIVDGVDVY